MWTKRAFIITLLWAQSLVACAPSSPPITPTAPASPSNSSSSTTKPTGQAPNYGLQNILYWRVKAPDTTAKPGFTSYLVGTVHVNFAEGYTWPVAFESALQGVSTLYLEADISEIEKNPQAVLEKTLDPQQRVAQNLSEAEFQSLADRLSTVGVPQAVLPLLKPWYVNLLLSAPPEAAVTKPSEVMDQLLKDKATASQVKVKYLESALAQFEMMASIPMDEHLRLIREALNQPAARNGEQIQASILAYNQGDLSELEASEAELKKESPPFYKRSLVQRNQAWLKTLIPALQSQSLMVGVGALHMVGENGLIQQLRAAGFAVELASNAQTGENKR